MKHWIAVASAAHVRIGQAGGFMQVCHGKGGPLRRISPGDRVAYYSPSEVMGRADGLRAFTALGVVRAGETYQAQMGEAFFPFRRDVAWQEARVVPILPLLDRLALTRGKRNWGYAFRFGLVEVSADDMNMLAEAMAPGGETIPFNAQGERHDRTDPLHPSLFAGFDHPLDA